MVHGAISVSYTHLSSLGNITLMRGQASDSFTYQMNRSQLALTRRIHDMNFYKALELVSESKCDMLILDEVLDLSLIHICGKPDAPLSVVGKTKRHGTDVTFKPDEKIFSELVFSYDTLKQRLRELAFLNKGLSITRRDEREDEAIEESFCYEGGIISVSYTHLMRFISPAPKLWLVKEIVA